jgi:hypothetical protein
MTMPYKLQLGAMEMPRHVFVETVHTCRTQSHLVPTQWRTPYEVSPQDIVGKQQQQQDVLNCRTILDRTGQQQQQQ